MLGGILAEFLDATLAAQSHQLRSEHDLDAFAGDQFITRDRAGLHRVGLALALVPGAHDCRDGIGFFAGCHLGRTLVAADANESAVADGVHGRVGESPVGDRAGLQRIAPGLALDDRIVELLGISCGVRLDLFLAIPAAGLEGAPVNIEGIFDLLVGDDAALHGPDGNADGSRRCTLAGRNRALGRKGRSDEKEKRCEQKPHGFLSFGDCGRAAAVSAVRYGPIYTMK